MNDLRDNKDDDTIPVKPLSLALITLTSAGAGLAAGLFISWLFCSHCCSPDDNARSVSENASISQVEAEDTVNS